MLHKVGKIRNAFAHGQLARSVRPQRDPESASVEYKMVVETLTNDLSVKEIDRLRAVDTFRESSDTLLAQLEILEDKIKNAKPY